MKDLFVLNKEGMNEEGVNFYNLNSAMELLKMMTEQGMIKADDAAKAILMNKRKVVEKYHKYAVYQDARGRYCTTIRDESCKNKRRMIAKSSEADLICALYDHYTGLDIMMRNSKMTIASMLPEWYEYKRNRGISEATILKYQTDWKRILKDTELVNVPIVELTRPYVDDWMHKLVKQHQMTEKEYINISTLIRQPLSYAVYRGIIDVSPMQGVTINSKEFRPCKKKASETQVFSQDEMEKLTAIAKADLENPHLVYKLTPLAFLFMRETALRIGEAVTVRFDDIDGDQINIQRMYVRDCHEVKDRIKGHADDRMVPLTKTAKAIIAEAKRRQVEAGVYDGGYIFSMTEEPLSYRALSDCYARYCEKAGISRRSSHKMRKTAISTWLDNGMNLNSAREIAGHSDERTTLNSYLFDRKSIEERRAIMEM